MSSVNFNKASVMVCCRHCGDELRTTIVQLQSSEPLICLACGEPIVIAPEVLRDNMERIKRIGRQVLENSSIGNRRS